MNPSIASLTPDPPVRLSNVRHKCQYRQYAFCPYRQITIEIIVGSNRETTVEIFTVKYYFCFLLLLLSLLSIHDSFRPS